MEVRSINTKQNKFELLREKGILSILDGDVDFGTLVFNDVDTDIKISMPYLSVLHCVRFQISLVVDKSKYSRKTIDKMNNIINIRLQNKVNK